MDTFSKIVLFVVFLIIFYGGFGLILLGKLSHIAHLVEKLHKHPFSISRSVIATSNDAIAISRNVKDMAMINDDLYRRNRLTEIKLYEADALRNMRHVLLLVEDNEGKELAHEAINLWTERAQLIDEVVQLIIAGDKREAEVMEIEGLVLLRKVERSLTKLANYAQRLSIKYRAQSNDDLRHAKIFLWAAGLIIAILSTVFAIYFYIWIFSSLKRTKRTLSLMTDNPIDLTMELQTPSLFGLNESINTLIEQLSANLNAVAKHIGEVENVIDGENSFPRTDANPQIWPVAESGYRALSLVMVQMKADLTSIERAISKDVSPSLPILKDIDQSLKNADNAIALIDGLAAQFAELVHVYKEEHEMNVALFHQKEKLSSIRDSIYALREDLLGFKLDSSSSKSPRPRADSSAS